MMGKTPWHIYAKHFAFEGKIPTKRRRAKWRANWKFQQLVQKLTPGDIVIDCGANVGEVTNTFAQTQATVYVFEPDPYCFSILEKRFSDCSNVKLFNKAVGIENGAIKLYRAENFTADPEFLSQSSSVYISKKNVCDLNAFEVEQIDFIAFVQALPSRVAILKIDIEGAEVPVIEHLLDTNAIERIDYLFAETHEKQIPELAERTVALRKRIAVERYSNIDLDWR
ncbi:MAG TPA: FkbM family methyltransferase [Hyphomicrobiales bacterium]|jgi:FkbM family methyltransferase